MSSAACNIALSKDLLIDSDGANNMCLYVYDKSEIPSMELRTFAGAKAVDVAAIRLVRQDAQQVNTSIVHTSLCASRSERLASKTPYSEGLTQP